MSAWRPWPYAATAIVQHEWDTNLLNVWLVFKYPMDQTVKPAHGLWLCKVDGVLKAITVSAWQDEWTILLTVPDVLALPGRVTLEYDGPSESLRTTWEKQWEPWGPILSRRIPYLWEDILVVDTVNKRVGINVAAPTEDLDVLGIVKAASIIAAAINKNTALDLKLFEDLDIDNAADGRMFEIFRNAAEQKGSLQFYLNSSRLPVINSNAFGGYIYLKSAGVTKAIFRTDTIQFFQQMWLQMNGNGTQGVFGFGAGAGGDARIWYDNVNMQINPKAVGIGYLNIMGELRVALDLLVSGSMSSGTLTHAAVGPTDNLDVSSVNTVFLDCSANNITIGGFTGGVDGQTLNIVRLCAAANDATLEHNEAHAFQKIFLHKGLDETLTGEYGGWTLVCNGTSWFDASHAKHV